MKQRRNMKKLLQKYLLVLFSLALVLSPFNSLGELAYAEGDANETGKTEITQKEKGNDDDANRETRAEGHQDDDDSANPTDESDGKPNGSNPEENPVEPSDREKTGNNESDPNNLLTSGDRSGGLGEDGPTIKKGQNDSPSTNILQNDPPNPTEDGFEWKLVAHLDVITITGYEGSDTENIIPSEIARKEVRYNGGNAFKNKSLDKVTIPETVTEIGIYAFYHSGIKEVIIPTGVREIQHA